MAIAAGVPEALLLPLQTAVAHDIFPALLLLGSHSKLRCPLSSCRLMAAHSGTFYTHIELQFPVGRDINKKKEEIDQFYLYYQYHIELQKWIADCYIVMLGENIEKLKNGRQRSTRLRRVADFEPRKNPSRIRQLPSERLHLGLEKVKEARAIQLYRGDKGEGGRLEEESDYETGNFVEYRACCFDLRQWISADGPSPRWRRWNGPEPDGRASA